MSTNKVKAETKSCVATFRKNGEVFAISHSHKATGYKALPSTSKFEGTTSYKCTFPDPNKTLATIKGGTGRRLSPKCDRTNNANIAYMNRNPITGGVADFNGRFKTMNQKVYIHHQGVPVGYSNQGIVAEQSKWIHKRQND